MEVLTTWPWGTIWQAIGALAAVLALIYAPYAVLWNALRADNKETRQNMERAFAFPVQKCLIPTTRKNSPRPDGNSSRPGAKPAT